MSVRYLGLADYVAIAVEVTGLDVETVMRAPNLGLAESALHAPAAAFDETEFYPDFVDKAAVLVVRLAKNHPLPDRSGSAGRGPALGSANLAQMDTPSAGSGPRGTEGELTQDPATGSEVPGFGIAAPRSRTRQIRVGTCGCALASPPR